MEKSPEIPLLSMTFIDDGVFPNSELPVLVFQQVFSDGEVVAPSEIEKTFHKNRWTGSWRNGLFSFHHYHSSAHEVLGIYSGWVKAELGGPSGKILAAKAGDVIVIPAGVVHKNIDQSIDFKVIGAYPKGQIPDMKNGRPGERPVSDQNISLVKLPEYDPVQGLNGPLPGIWKNQ